MELIKQSHEIISITPNLIQQIEQAGRTCYKSESNITPQSATKFVKMLRDRGHHAMLEFGQIVIRLVTNRGVTHELVRHRLFSFAQESTRYVRYNNIEFIEPVWWPISSAIARDNFSQQLIKSEESYRALLDEGWRPEQAREVLPNALKTEIVVCGNPREWRHALTLRTSKHAHPQIRNLMDGVKEDLNNLVPVLFEDL